MLLQSWFFYLSKLLAINDIRFVDYLKLVPEDVRESSESLKRITVRCWSDYSWNMSATWAAERVVQRRSGWP